VAGKIGAAIIGVFTVTVLTGYLLASFPGLRRGALLVLPAGHRVRAGVAVDRAIDRVGAYVAGNVVTSLVCTASTVIALVLIGVPFAIPLGLWAGVMDLLPIIGAYLGAAPAIIVGLFVSPATGIVTAIYFLVYQQVENYVLIPRVMRGAVHLSPASVILSTLLGVSLAGIAGALLALPVAATIKVLVVEIWLRERAVAGDPVAREEFTNIRREERVSEKG
jgi:predicted PurR-regulated permease PerM